MQHSSAGIRGTTVPNEHLTILRVKRKRDQEPLEALVIHQQKKKAARDDSTGDESAKQAEDEPLLFALGETISEAEFGDASKRIALQSRLATLAKRRRSDVEPQEETVSAQSKPKRFASSADLRQSKFRVMGRRQVQLIDDVPQQASTSESSNFGIPQVVASADLEAAKHKIQMFDAINEDDFMTTLTKKKADPYAGLALGTTTEPAAARAKNTSGDAATQELMDSLLPMVRDYMSLSQPKPEYVYDFYYVQQTRADATDPRVLHAPNVGSVLWIDEADELLDEGDSDDGNGGDTDSNAEDYYTNDYPDEPDVDSEIEDFYYSSDEREQLRAEDSDSYSDYEW